MNAQEREPVVRRNRWVLGAAAAAVVAALGIGIGVMAGGDDGGGGGSDEPTVLALKAPPGNSMQSCMMFSVDVLRGMPVAFDGTVTDVTGDQVTLDVGHWYKGGDADVVTVANFDTSMTSLEGGIDYTEGKRYLITAADGTVNVCGFSAEYSGDMAAAFAEAFGS